MTPEPEGRHSFHIRVPEDLWERLVKAAEEDFQPYLNTLVVQALVAWLDARDAEKKGEE